MKKIGIALGAGGAKGLCHIAFLEALEDLGYRPSIISGTSIGALIGAFYASGLSAAEMKARLKKMNLFQMGKMIDFSIWKTSGMMEGRGIEKFLKKNLPVRIFENLPIPLKIVATDFWKRDEVIFKKGDLVQAVRASISMPALLMPIRFEGRVLIDGGAVNPLPYDIIRGDCDLLIAIDASGEKTPPHEQSLPNMLESIVSNIQIMEASIIKNMMKIIKPDIYVKPELRGIRVLDFYKFDEIIGGMEEDIENFKFEVRKRMRKFSFLKKK